MQTTFFVCKKYSTVVIMNWERQVTFLLKVTFWTSTWARWTTGKESQTSEYALLWGMERKQNSWKFQFSLPSYETKQCRLIKM